MRLLALGTWTKIARALGSRGRVVLVLVLGPLLARGCSCPACSWLWAWEGWP